MKICRAEEKRGCVSFLQNELRISLPFKYKTFKEHSMFKTSIFCGQKSSEWIRDKDSTFRTEESKLTQRSDPTIYNYKSHETVSAKFWPVARLLYAVSGELHVETGFCPGGVVRQRKSAKK